MISGEVNYDKNYDKANQKSATTQHTRLFKNRFINFTTV